MYDKRIQNREIIERKWEKYTKNTGQFGNQIEVRKLWNLTGHPVRRDAWRLRNLFSTMDPVVFLENTRNSKEPELDNLQDPSWIIT